MGDGNRSVNSVRFPWHTADDAADAIWVEYMQEGAELGQLLHHHGAVAVQRACRRRVDWAEGTPLPINNGIGLGSGKPVLWKFSLLETYSFDPNFAWLAPAAAPPPPSPRRRHRRPTDEVWRQSQISARFHNLMRDQQAAKRFLSCITHERSRRQLCGRHFLVFKMIMMMTMMLGCEAWSRWGNGWHSAWPGLIHQVLLTYLPWAYF